MSERDFPTGYFGCCGRSRARGHHELCSHYPKAMEARQRQDAKRLDPKDDSAVPNGDLPNV